MLKLTSLLVLFSILLFLIKTKKYVEHFEEHEFKIVMFLTGGLKEEAENCIKTLKNQNLDKELTVTALDIEAFEYIKKLNVNTQLKKTNLKKEAKFGTKDFFDITYNKLCIIQNTLEKYNKVVLYTDSDVVFLKDIRNDIKKFKISDKDILIQDDSKKFKNSKNYCTGFILFKPNKTCVEILKEAKNIMKKNWDNRSWDKGGGADQKALQESIKNLRDKNMIIKLETLDLKEYPNGARYFKNLNTIYKNYKPNIVHNNYIKGTDKKIRRFKRHNLWFI